MPKNLHYLRAGGGRGARGQYKTQDLSNEEDQDEEN